VGRLFGIRLRVHWLLPITIATYLIKDATRAGLWGLERTGITTLIYLASVLIHEFGHCFTAIRVGGGAEQILLWPLGGLSSVHHSSSPRVQIKVSGIGPLTNFLIAGAAVAGLLLAARVPWSWEYLSPFGDWWPYNWSNLQCFILHALKLNMVLGLFNLIPAFPLDGGRMLVAGLTLRYGREHAAVVNSYVAIPIGLALTVGAFSLGDLLLGLIGIWVLFEAWQIRQLARMGRLEEHPAFADVAEFEYMPDREKPRRKGWFGRWREKRAQKSREREAVKDEVLRSRVDEVLEKVSREGLGSLSADEKRILEEASRRSRGESP
jgi:Zn-dependent protease